MRPSCRQKEYLQSKMDVTIQNTDVLLHPHGANKSATKGAHHGHDRGSCGILPLGTAYTIGAARVEGQPAPPEHEETHARVHRITQWQRVVTISIASQTWSQHRSRSKGGGTAYQVNRTTAGNVHRAEIVEESVFTPHPAGGYAVDNRIKQREQTVGLKIAAVREEIR